MGIYRLQEPFHFLCAQSVIATWSRSGPTNTLHRVVSEPNSPFFDRNGEEVAEQSEVKAHSIGRARGRGCAALGVFPVQSGQSLVAVLGDDLGGKGCK